MKTDQIADYVYHFMPLHRAGREREDLDHVKAAVLNSEYFFSNPLHFNDPFDCKPNFLSTPRDTVDHTRLRKHLTDALAQIGVFCVAEELYNTLMWSHYTNGHRGIALQFSTKRIIMAVKGIGMVDKVKYQTSLPTIRWGMGHKIDQMRRIIFRKSKRWVYEKEVRIVLLNTTQGVHVLNQMPVRNIYFGCKIEKEDEDQLLAVFKGHGNRIYKLKMSSNRFAYWRSPLAE